MEQIQFIYFQYYMQYYTVHHIENSTYMEIWHRGFLHQPIGTVRAGHPYNLLST